MTPEQLSTFDATLKTMNVHELLAAFMMVNDSFSLRAAQIKDSVTQDHPHFEIAVQIEKDAARTVGEAAWLESLVDPNS